MGEEIAISLKNVSKCFLRYNRPVDRLKEVLFPGKKGSDEFWALRDINLEIPKGQTVGIVGRNGSGKSTMLQIIAGTLTSTTGEVSVKGRVSALLELGSGFNLEFTGRQNVFFNGRLLGLTQNEIEEKYDEIAGFADIGDFIEQPVKTYSSGMFVRLAFAVAVNVDPEILIVDEALAVGDVVFQHRCMRRMRALMDSGVTTLFVSHDSGAIKTLCNSAAMIEKGRIYTTGVPNLVINEYMKLMTDLELGLLEAEGQNEKTSQTKSVPTTSESHTAEKSEINLESLDRYQDKNLFKQSRRGNRQAVIEDIKLLDSLGGFDSPSPIFKFNEEVTLEVTILANQSLKSCLLGFYICDKNGNEILGTNTFEEKYFIGEIASGETIKIRFKFNIPLRPGSYSLTVAGSESYQSVTFDWIDNAMVFQVLPPDTGKTIYPLVDVPVVIEVHQNHQLLPTNN